MKITDFHAGFSQFVSETGFKIEGQCKDVKETWDKLTDTLAGTLKVLGELQLQITQYEGEFESWKS